MESHYFPEPLSPTAQFFNTSSLCLYIFAVWEFEVPIPDLPLVSFIKGALPSIPRFTSLLVSDKKGVKRWEPVEMKIEDHIVEPPLFSHAMSNDLYAKCFSDYLSEIAMEQLSHSKPLWQVHVIKYPTTTLVFKIHHSLGDGYTLMGVFLSLLQRADDPTLPLTFPSLKSSKPHQTSLIRRFPTFFSSFFNSIVDFGWSLLKSNLIEDDKTPIRSGVEGVEFLPATLFSITFPLDHIKEIKSILGVTVNGVVTGIILYGIRLYMQDVEYSSRTKYSTLASIINMRNVKGYQTTKEMQKTNGKGTWGNQLSYMLVSVPKLEDTHISNPLLFVRKIHDIMQSKKRSLVHSLIKRLLLMRHKFQGPEAVAKQVKKTLRNSSLLMSNMIGPLHQVAMANHPIKALYFTLSGVPQSVVITIVSYMGMLRVTTRTEKGFIDEQKLAQYVNNAYDIIRKAALEIPNNTKF